MRKLESQNCTFIIIIIIIIVNNFFLFSWGGGGGGGGGILSTIKEDEWGEQRGKARKEREN